MTPDLAASRIRQWRAEPARMVRDLFRVEPDEWQLEALAAFADPAKRRIAMKACAGPGKTCCMAWIAYNFLLCYGEVGKHPRGAAVGPSWDNLRDNLWREMAKWREASPLLKSTFIWTAERIFAKDHPATWGMTARGYSKGADPETQGNTLSGLHEDYILYLLDESGEMPVSILRKAEQGMGSCKFGKIVQSGNPTSLEGTLYECVVRQREKWATITITGDPDDPRRSPRVDITWAREQIELYGRENPWVMAYILGQFPPSSINTLMGVEDVESAMRRQVSEATHNWAQKRLGVDVARFGDDRTVLFPRQGAVAFKPVEMRHARNSAVAVDIATRVMQAKLSWSSEMEFFDDTVGWAHGAIDVMRAAGLTPIPVAFDLPSPNKRYFNMRAECWFSMAEWVKNGGCLPQVDGLVAELCTPTYTFHKGKLIIEPKDQIKKRLRRSPDLADALALTFAIPDMPTAGLQLGESGKILSDYDPLDPARM